MIVLTFRNCIVYSLTLFFGILTLSCGSKITKDSSENSHKPDNTTENEKAFFASNSTTLTMVRTKSNFEYTYYEPVDSIKIQFAVFFIDAHGRQNLAIDKYKSLADHFGLTLIGIKSIRNGMDHNKVLRIWNEIRSDIDKRISIHPKSMIAGFSGGARYATYLADNDTNVLNVLGCSAGFYKNITSYKDVPYNYWGLVGNLDFNYVEMMSLKDRIEPFPKTQFICSWDGIHEWPDTEIMNKAFIWYMNTLHKQKLIVLDDNVIKHRFNQTKPKINEIPSTNGIRMEFDLLNELEITELMLFLFNGVHDCEAYLKHRKEIYRPDAFKNQLAQSRVDLNYESKQQQIFAQNIMNKDSTWWSSQFNKSNFKSNRHEQIHKRLLQFCGLRLYFICQNSLANKDYNNLTKYAWIYKNISPNNNEALYFSAICSAIRNDNERALNLIDAAVRNGFQSVSRINDQPEFLNIRNDQKFIEIINKLN